MKINVWNTSDSWCPTYTAQNMEKYILNFVCMKIAYRILFRKIKVKVSCSASIEKQKSFIRNYWKNINWFFKWYKFLCIQCLFNIVENKFQINVPSLIAHNEIIIGWYIIESKINQLWEQTHWYSYIHFVNQTNVKS